MNYAELRKVNVNDHIEKKNGLSYLSWAWAVDTLLQNDATATWTYDEPKAFGETLMVFCTVNAFGKSMTAQLPVMNYRNQAIENPNSMEVNTAMQRCLAKAIALHGLGLYIYAGEDLPEEDVVQAPKDVRPLSGALDGFSAADKELLHGIAEQITNLVNLGDVQAAKNEVSDLTNEEKTALWSLLDSKIKSSLRKG